jgi:hypothetical protein
VAGLLISLGLCIGVVLLTGACYLRRNRTVKEEIIQADKQLLESGEFS